MSTIVNTLSLICVLFVLYFLMVVCLDAERTQQADIKKGVKYQQPVYKTMWRYLKQSFWYHFPKL